MLRDTPRMRTSITTVLALTATFISSYLGAETTSKSRPLELSLQRRDPQTDKITIQPETIDSSKIGVVVIDMWNGYMCPTGAELFGGSLVPRMSRALDGARTLGMTVIHAPSDVADFYAGWPQAEKVAALPRYELPKVADVAMPGFPGYQDPCLCGPGIKCPYMHSWDGIHPDLKIADEDYILVGPSYGERGTQRLHAICRDRGLTHLIYMGCATNCCVVAKAAGAIYMANAGIPVILARDLTEAVTKYDPESNYTPDDGTTQSVKAIERASMPTIDMADELNKVGLWGDNWRTDPVHMFPHWSDPAEPYTFEDSFVMTLSSPRLPDSQIHYTLDGSEPELTSAVYTERLKISQSGNVRAAAFQGGRQVGLESKCHFVRIIPLPPEPDVHLSDLTPVRATAPLMLDGHTSTGIAENIGIDRSFGDLQLRVQGTTYEKGMGVHSPSQLLYELRPDFEEFVALAGVDDQVLDHDSGMHVANHPSVVFRVFIDGRQVAESPTIRTGRTWRFRVKIPPGSELISLATMDAGDGRFEDVADWVRAGFLLKEIQSR